MITRVHTSWMVGSLRTKSIPSPFPHKFLLTPFLSAFSPLSSAGPFASGSAYVLFIPLVHSSLRLCAFFLSFWFVKEPGGYALSSLGLSYFLLPSRHPHLPPVSSASRACGTPPRPVLLRGAAVIRSLFCRLEWPCAR